jgi:hypothetical protein
MAQKISTEEELEVLLASLGGSPAVVAAALVAAGVKGKRSTRRSCPVANWLRLETGLDPSVDDDRVALREAEDLRTRVEVRTPDAVRGFIYDFEDGEYVDLDEEPDLFVDD